MLGAWPFLRYTILGQLFRHNSAYYTVRFRSNKGGRNSITTTGFDECFRYKPF